MTRATASLLAAQKNLGKLMIIEMLDSEPATFGTVINMASILRTFVSYVNNVRFARPKRGQTRPIAAVSARENGTLAARE
jgi:hypothetical protein